MTFVNFSDVTEDIRARTNLDANDVITTINDRHRGIVDPGFNRLIAVHWFGKERCVFVDSEITATEHRKEEKKVKINEVRVAVALNLRPRLPTMIIAPGQELEPLAITIAESFGHPVSCHPDTQPEALYTGPWDGKQITVVGAPERDEVVLMATLNKERKEAFAAWALNISRYLAWWEENRTPKN